MVGTINRILTESKDGISIGITFHRYISDGAYWFSENDIRLYNTPHGSNDVIDTPELAGGMQVDKIIYSGPKTIILWHDGTKSIVSCSEDDHYDYCAGFCAVVTQKVFGTNSQIRKLLKNKSED